MGRTGDLKGGKAVADGHGDFGGHKPGIGGDDRSANDMVGFIGEKFDKAVFEVFGTRNCEVI